MVMPEQTMGNNSQNTDFSVNSQKKPGRGGNDDLKKNCIFAFELIQKEYES